MNDDTGDIRYRPDIQGYNRDLRKRVRDTEHQVNLLVTSRIRDTATAAQELAATTTSLRIREIVEVARLCNNHQARRADKRAAWISLAATAIINAENADRPRALGGTAPQAGIARTQPANAVPIRQAPMPKPKTRTSRPKTAPGQISLWEASA